MSGGRKDSQAFAALPLVFLLAKYPKWVMSVYAALASFQGRSGECFPSLAQIAFRANVEKSNVSKAISRLRKDNWIECHRGSGASSVYVVLAQEGTWARLPIAFLQAGALSTRDLMVYACLSIYQGKDPNCYPSRGQIASRLGSKSLSSISKSISKLKREGWLAVLQRGRNANLYTLSQCQFDQAGQSHSSVLTKGEPSQCQFDQAGQSSQCQFDQSHSSVLTKPYQKTPQKTPICTASVRSKHSLESHSANLTKRKSPHSAVLTKRKPQASLRSKLQTKEGVRDKQGPSVKDTLLNTILPKLYLQMKNRIERAIIGEDQGKLYLQSNLDANLKRKLEHYLGPALIFKSQKQENILAHLEKAVFPRLSCLAEERIRTAILHEEAGCLNVDSSQLGPHHAHLLRSVLGERVVFRENKTALPA